MDAPRVSAQSATADWEKAAGGEVSFDVASVKPSPINAPFSDASFPLDDSDQSPGKLAHFSANVPLFVYISFAYKLPAYENSSLLSQLPKWANADRFDTQARQRFEIEARAELPSTKDQMRLMMQSLLADRFKLRVHWETRQVPSFDLVLIKPGKTGPQLQPHNDKIPCEPYKPAASGYDYIPGQPLAFCGKLESYWGSRNIREAGRKITMSQLAQAMSTSFGRPVLDKTGLQGAFDIDLNYQRDPSEWDARGIDDFRAALIAGFHDQLGLKLESSKAADDVLIIDHVEEPSPN